MQIRTAALAAATLAALTACDDAAPPVVAPEPTMALPALPQPATTWADLESRFGDLDLSTSDPDAQRDAGAADLPPSGRTDFTGVMELRDVAPDVTAWGDVAVSTFWASGETVAHAGNFLDTTDQVVAGELTGDGTFLFSNADPSYLLDLPLGGDLTVAGGEAARHDLRLLGRLVVRDGELIVNASSSEGTAADAVLFGGMAGE